MTLKFTDYLLAGLAVGLFITVIVSAMYYFQTQYGAPDASTQLAGYDKINQTLTQIQDIKTNTSQISTERGAFDIIGSFFAQGYTAYKLTSASASIIDEIGTNAISQSQLGDNGTTFKAYFSATIIIIFVIAVLAVILNKDF